MKVQQNRREVRSLVLAVLLLGVVAAGCDGLLGLDGLKAGCDEGARRCVDNAPEQCNAHGAWERQESCGAKACIATGPFRCVDCTPASKRCLSNTPQNCNDDGQWKSDMPCASGQVCSGGSCTCISGDRRCSANTPQICNASNQWEDFGAACTGQTCDVEVVACVGVCEPGGTQCQNATTAQDCDTHGLWQTTATCAIGCISGKCTTCTPGQKRCAANTPQSCGPDGQWQGETACSHQTCLAGTCEGDCVSGSKRCAGKWPQTCDLGGVWQNIDQPCALGESCYQAQCEVFCTPGAKRCAGDYPQTCDANGGWQSDGTACGQCIECDSATGICEAEQPVAVCAEPTAIDAGGNHICALLLSGKVKCWGDNDYGQLGLGHMQNRGDEPGEMGRHLPPVDLGLGAVATAISVGFSHTCALLEGGYVKCWGTNVYGQLGLGDKNPRGDGVGPMGENLLPVDLGGVTATAISAGEAHTCALLSDGSVKCWGRNASGQLGLGDTNDRGEGPNEMGANLPTVKLGGVTATAISAGGAHTCALLSNGSVKCWGDNEYGQLGLGDTNTRGEGPNEMGANLLPVNLGQDVTATAISAGGGHTCARLSDDSVKCWGYNEYGQLGLGDTNTRGDEPNEMSGNLLPVNLGQDVTATAISAGGAHTCARLSDDSVKCWGENSGGRLGLGDISDRGDDLGEMSGNLSTVKLGLGATAIGISASYVHTCALLSGGSVKCWGYNSDGQLGLGDTVDRGDGPNEMGDSLPPVDL